MENNLYRQLEENYKSDYYPFHMPGHKRNMHGYPMQDIYGIDITEIEGFDNLHHAEGILLTEMQKAAALYQSEETHFLVNGSTCGILSAISAAVKKQGKILIARNCHKAAYNAIFLRELQPVYLHPKIQKDYMVFGGIAPEDVEEALDKHPDIEAVFITSPTYEGIVSDIRKIADIVHKREIPLLVDEAHGAHFGFAPGYPRSAVTEGADVVIQSVHKTLPAFTQTALLHINGTIVNRNKLHEFLGIYQTSSPSYILMSGIVSALSIVEKRGKELFESLSHNKRDFMERCTSLQKLRVMDSTIVGTDAVYDLDLTKIVISTKGTSINGKELYNRLLQQYHLQMELEDATYVIAMTSIMDTKEGFLRLAAALQEIDATIEKLPAEEVKRQETFLQAYEAENKDAVPTLCSMRIADIEDKQLETVPLEESSGEVAGEFVYVYPPGIPILAPGEVITQSVLTLISEYQKNGFRVQGMEDYTGNSIQVVKKM